MRGKVATILLLKKYDFQKFKNGLFAHKNKSICYKPQSTKTQVNIPFEHFAQKNQSTRYNRKKCIFVHFCNTCFRSIPTPITPCHSAFAQKNQSTRYNQTGRYNTVFICRRPLCRDKQSCELFVERGEPARFVSQNIKKYPNFR